MARASLGGAPLLALLALFLLAAQPAASSLMAIELGSEYLKVCLIKPGRTPIAIVGNEMSRRKSPALVGVVNGDRVLGEEAFSLGIRYPDLIFSRTRDLLGRRADDPLVRAISPSWTLRTAATSVMRRSCRRGGDGRPKS